MSAARKMTSAVVSCAVLCCVVLLWASGPAAASGAPEAPTTEAATGVTGTAATLHGTLNPKKLETDGWYFAYSSQGECTSGLTTAVEPEKAAKAQKVQISVSELEPSTKYTACLVATRTSEEVTETTVGSAVTFVTPRAVPRIDSQSVGPLSPSEGVIEAAINPERESTVCEIEYGTSTAYGTVIPCEPSNLGGGFGDQVTSTHVAGLEPATTYFYRLVARNATGTAHSQGEFTTPGLEAPVVESETASTVTATSAVLEAEVAAGYQETTYRFEYGTAESLSEATIVGGGSLSPSGEAQLAGPVDLGALRPGTTYYYRVVAENPSGATEGPVQSFTTNGVPVVVTGGVEAVGRTVASLTGTVNSEGGEANYRFVYIDNAGYEEALAKSSPNPYANGGETVLASLPASHEPVEVGPTRATELAPGTLYHYALVVTSEAGQSFGEDETFTTAAPTPPTVSTGGAGGVGQSSATLEGSIDPHGLATSYEFQIALEGAFSSEGFGLVSPNGETQGASSGVSGLIPGRSYRYRLCATNSDGTVCGAEQSFTTLSLASLTTGNGPTFPLLVGVAPVPGPTVRATSGPPLPTRAQRLAKALKSCKKKTSKSKRARCRALAKRRYGVARKK